MATSSGKSSPSLASVMSKEEAKEVKEVKPTAEKTPDQVAAETPEESAARYGIDTSKLKAKQVPSGTHLHPDVVESMLSVPGSQMTDNAQVQRVVSDGYEFAPDAETNDKF